MYLVQSREPSSYVYSEQKILFSLLCNYCIMMRFKVFLVKIFVTVCLLRWNTIYLFICIHSEKVGNNLRWIFRFRLVLRLGSDNLFMFFPTCTKNKTLMHAVQLGKVLPKINNDYIKQNTFPLCTLDILVHSAFTRQVSTLSNVLFFRTHLKSLCLTAQRITCALSWSLLCK